MRTNFIWILSEASTFYPSTGASSSMEFSSCDPQAAALQQQVKELKKQLEEERQHMKNCMDHNHVC